MSRSRISRADWFVLWFLAAVLVIEAGAMGFFLGRVTA